MVKLTFLPWSEIVIHEIIEEKAEDLFKAIVKQALSSGAVGITPTINWADGVVFLIGVFPDTDDIVRDKLKGILHYAYVQYAKFPDYKPEVQVGVGGTHHPIRLQKVESNPTLVELSSYLKAEPFKK